jgi:hypothetical protein
MCAQMKTPARFGEGRVQTNCRSLRRSPPHTGVPADRSSSAGWHWMTGPN